MIFFRLIGESVYVRYSLVPQAMINTIVAFTVIFLTISILNYGIIYRFKLIQLFKAESKGEKELKG